MPVSCFASSRHEEYTMDWYYVTLHYVPSDQWLFVSGIMDCRTNRLLVQWDIFQTIAVSE